MSFYHGKNTEVWLEGKDISTWLNDMQYSADVDTADATTFKSDWKSSVVGQASAKVDCKGLYDKDLDDITSILAVEAGKVLTLGPAGMEALGARAWLVKALSTSYAESSPVGGVVAFSWAVVADGNVGFGVVLHPLAAVSADGNGSSHTGPVGGTATGAVAHLHVTEVSASDSIVVTVEDSANNTDWLPIAGGAFASKSAPGAERLVIPGTIRRYLRAAHDVTGAGVSIKYALAVART